MLSNIYKLSSIYICTILIKNIYKKYFCEFYAACHLCQKKKPTLYFTVFYNFITTSYDCCTKCFTSF